MEKRQVVRSGHDRKLAGTRVERDAQLLFERGRRFHDRQAGFTLDQAFEGERRLHAGWIRCAEQELDDGLERVEEHGGIVRSRR